MPSDRWTSLSRNLFATTDVLLQAIGGLLMLAAPAWGAQALDVRDGDTVLARISIRDQTRIRVERGRVTDVLGDIYDATANPTGRIALVRDESDGEVYIKPTPGAATLPAGIDGAAGAVTALTAPSLLAPVKLDIKSDRGTFALLVQPSDVVGDTLVLRPSGPAASAATATGAFSVRRGASHERSIKALTLAMANPDLAGEFAPRMLPAGGQEVALWREARFVLKAVFGAPGLVGESFDLTNVSGQRMVLDERELYRDGVVAVSIKRLVLAPGESTQVWVLRQPREQD